MLHKIRMKIFSLNVLNPTPWLGVHAYELVYRMPLFKQSEAIHLSPRTAVDWGSLPKVVVRPGATFVVVAAIAFRDGRTKYWSLICYCLPNNSSYAHCFYLFEKWTFIYFGALPSTYYCKLTTPSFISGHVFQRVHKTRQSVHWKSGSLISW